TYPELLDALARGDIDLVPPIISVLPARMLDILFSKEIENTGFRTTVLVARSRKSVVAPLSTAQVRVHVMDGELGEILAKDIFPSSRVGSISAYGSPGAACSALISQQQKQADKKISDLSSDLHCFVADEMICLKELENFPALEILDLQQLEIEYSPITLS